MTSILVFGRSGQLSRALAYSAQNIGYSTRHIGSDILDLATDPKASSDLILQTADVDLVINASAYTAVDAAETDMEKARNLNCYAPEAMARACRKAGLPFLHISTDYVFQGDASIPYKPSDPIAPLNAYGLSKAEGEVAVMAANSESAIFRTSWVYDGIGKNFLTTMLRLARDRDVLSIVDDQVGRPTYAPHLADALIVVAGKMKTTGYGGVYHISGEGKPVSWYGFAMEIFRLAGEFTHVPSQLLPIPSEKFPTPAKRPSYSVLDNSHFRKIFDHKMPDWEKGVIDAIATIKAQQ